MPISAVQQARLVAWRTSDRLDLRSADLPAVADRVASAMSAALAGVLTGFGFPVVPIASSTALLVPVCDR